MIFDEFSFQITTENGVSAEKSEQTDSADFVGSECDHSISYLNL